MTWAKPAWWPRLPSSRMPMMPPRVATAAMPSRTASRGRAPTCRRPTGRAARQPPIPRHPAQREGRNDSVVAQGQAQRCVAVQGLFKRCVGGAVELGGIDVEQQVAEQMLVTQLKGGVGGAGGGEKSWRRWRGFWVFNARIARRVPEATARSSPPPGRTPRIPPA